MMRNGRVADKRSRSKEPEYGLYMLNRAIVKNVLLPLVPGEIRVTPTSDSMLIVEKRGEGMSYHSIISPSIPPLLHSSIYPHTSAITFTLYGSEY